MTDSNRKLEWFSALFRLVSKIRCLVGTQLASLAPSNESELYL